MLWDTPWYASGRHPCNYLHAKLLTAPVAHSNHDLNRAALREAGFTTQCSLALCATDPPLALSHYPLRQMPVGAINLHGHLHEGTEPTRRHINLAVEQTDYSPVGLIWMLDKARQRRLAGQSIQGGSGSEAPQRTARFGRPERCPP